MSLTHSQNFQGMNSQKQDKINRELHVGNTNPAIRPDQLENFLNAAMIQGGLVTSPGLGINGDGLRNGLLLLLFPPTVLFKDERVELVDNSPCTVCPFPVPIL